MYRINVYIPESHLEVVKTAMFNAGAGRMGNYEHCCWQIQGQGQFRPLAGSNAFIGKQGSSETVDEFKVELVCESAVLSLVITAMKQVHPYEEPAYDVYQPIDI
ncbi:MAG: hypothetical protein ACJA0E_001764 [Bermanella sp.]|jgi:hypothetical protein